MEDAQTSSGEEDSSYVEKKIPKGGKELRKKTQLATKENPDTMRANVRALANFRGTRNDMVIRTYP